jgi:hypothetical protein
MKSGIHWHVPNFGAILCLIHWANDYDHYNKAEDIGEQTSYKQLDLVLCDLWREKASKLGLSDKPKWCSGMNSNWRSYSSHLATVSPYCAMQVHVHHVTVRLGLGTLGMRRIEVDWDVLGEFLIYWGFKHSSIPPNHFNPRVPKLGLSVADGETVPEPFDYPRATKTKHQWNIPPLS